MSWCHAVELLPRGNIIIWLNTGRGWKGFDGQTDSYARSAPSSRLDLTQCNVHSLLIFPLIDSVCRFKFTFPFGCRWESQKWYSKPMRSSGWKLVTLERLELRSDWQWTKDGEEGDATMILEIVPWQDIGQDTYGINGFIAPSTVLMQRHVVVGTFLVLRSCSTLRDLIQWS